MTSIHTAAKRLEFIRSSVMLGQLLAVLLCLAAIGIRLLTDNVLLGFPFLTFFPAITLAAFLGGRAAGITAAILGGLLAQYYLIEPINSFVVAWPAGWVAIGFYVLTTTIIIGLINAMFAAFDRQRDSENRLQMALSAGGGVGAWDLDIASGLVTANEQFARLYGVDPARARAGAKLAEFFGHVHSGDRVRVQASVERAIATGGEFHEDYRLVQSDGTVRWVAAFGRCTHDGDGAPARFPGVSFDITARKATEEKLRLLNADLERQVVERSSERGTTWQLSPHLLSVINLETGCFSRVNPGWTAAMGWSEDELVGKPFYDFLHPDDLEITRVAWANVQGGEAALNFENRYLTKSGETRVLSWVAVPEQGFLYCTARDVTADRALKDSEAQFRTMAQAMPHHVWTAPASGELDWFNERVYEYSGAGRGTLDGNGWAAIVHPDDLAEAGSRWGRAVASGQIYEAEFRLRGADGAYRWHIARAVPLRDESGGIVRWIGTNTDIEEERQVRLRLSEAQSELNTLLNSTASAFYSVSADGSTTSCNAEFLRILGFDDASEVIGKTLHDTIHHTHPDGSPYPKEDCPILVCAQNGTEAYVPDEIYFRKDGAPVPVEYWVRGLYRDGVLTGAVCNFNDISERKQADEQRVLLLNELNHRVKNLFALVGGIISISAKNATSAKDLAAALQGRLSALSRAHELIQPGLRPGRSQEGADLAGLIGQIFAPYAASNLDERLQVAGPRIGLSQSAVTGMALIFHELATNAAKYGALRGAEGKIAITWHAEGGMLDLRWRETGCPPREALPQTQGFGSVLLRRSVESQFAGKLAYDWRPDGLEIAIVAPLSRL